MSEFAAWPSRDAPVSAASLAREMMALTQATLSPPPFPEDAARGDGEPVIVIPGFLAPDMSTARLREFLSRQNFTPHAWTAGVNLGPMRHVMHQIERQVRDLAGQTGRKVALVGVSLGGTIARQAAKCCPGQIARVITLVSPIHPPITTPLAPLAQAAALLWDSEELKNLAAISEPPPVPLTAIVSRDDGIIDWRTSVPAPSEMVEVVEISGAHMAICSNPEAQYIIAERLARLAK